MSIEVILIIGLAWLIIHNAKRIMDRLDSLPPPKAESVTWHEEVDQTLVFQIKHFWEEPFRIQFVDGWEVGRSFCASCTLADYSRDIVEGRTEEDPDWPRRQLGLQFRDRTTVQFFPTVEPFMESQIGRLESRKGQAGLARIHLPFQFASAVLNELRLNPQQDISLGLKRIETKEGKVRFGIFSFELNEPT